MGHNSNGWVLDAARQITVHGDEGHYLRFTRVSMTGLHLHRRLQLQLEYFSYRLLVDSAIDWLSSKLPLWLDSVPSAHTIPWLQPAQRSLPLGVPPYPL